MADRQIVVCDSHGRRLWDGHIVCATCGHGWYHFASLPELCGCGVRLRPWEQRYTVHALVTADVEPKLFSARLCCADCWNALPKGRKTLLPVRVPGDG